MAILTKKLLQQVNACVSSIEFCEQHSLFGLPLSMLDFVKGYYQGYVPFLTEKRIVVNENNDVIQYVNDDHQLVKFSYDSRGNIIREERFYPNTNIPHYWIDNQYDENNNLTRSDSNDGKWKEHRYDSNNNPIYEIASFWQYPFTSEFDSNNNLIRITRGSDIYTFSYDSNNNLIKATQPNGDWVESKYNSDNKIIERKTSDHNWETWKYDDKKRVVFYKNSEKQERKETYDERGNLIKSEDEHKKVTTHEIEYWPNGQLKQYDSLFIPFYQK